MIEEFRDYLNEEVFFNITVPDDYIVVNENGIGSAVSKLKIEHLPQDSLAFTLDHDKINYDQLSLYLNKSLKKINKSCDLVILFEEEGKYIFNLVELKSKEYKRDDVFTQLNNSMLFLKYILDLMRTYGTFPEKKIDYRYFLVCKKRKPIIRAPTNAKSIKFKTVLLERIENGKSTLGFGKLKY